MAKKKSASGGPSNGTAANLGFEAKLWLTADKLRNNMDAAEYKHVVLGLIFLKYISDAFEERHQKLLAEVSEGADPEDPDEYRADNVFWVPTEARWQTLQDNAKQPTIGKLIDEAMVAIERDNPRLKGILPKDFGRPALDKHRLGELIDVIGTIGLGDAENRSKDILGRVYEYFLTQFASAEGKSGGQFYTPWSVDWLIISMLAPVRGQRVYDPCFSSGPRLVMAAEYVRRNGGGPHDVSLFGQDAVPTARRLGLMHFAIRGIEANIGAEAADPFRRDLHQELKADFVVAGPQFNQPDWHRSDEDVRWKYGLPPKGNANFAWVQHFIHHLSPNGFAGFVLANGSMSSNQSGEGEIRKAIIDADLVDCMVALPGQLFYSTQIPVCLWFLTRSKRGVGFQPAKSASQNLPTMRDRRGETLFIDARKLGTLIDRVHRELTDADIARIADTYHSWRGDKSLAPKPSPLTPYSDLPGFCKSAKTAEIAEHGYVLTPGRYVGAEEVEDDAEPFAEKMQRLTTELAGQFEESAKLEVAIRQNLTGLGYSMEEQR